MKETKVVHVELECNDVVEEEAPVILEENERTPENQKGSRKRKKEDAITLKRKKKKRRELSGVEDRRDKVVKEGEETCQEEKTFNWRNYQWQTAINKMNARIVKTLSSLRNARKLEKEYTSWESPHNRESHKKVESGIVQLPPLDVPSEWILESAQIERRMDDDSEEINFSKGSTSSPPEEESGGWIADMPSDKCTNKPLRARLIKRRVL